MSIDVMKQALEAIEWALDFIPPESETDCECPLCAAHDALRLAIEQAERQEPAAWITEWNGKLSSGTVLDYKPHRRGPSAKHIPLYTAPPQRQPLTDEQVCDLWSWSATAEAERTATTQQHAFARAIERAHGIG